MKFFESNKEKIYSISELANELDISPRTIRFYEEKKLISPGRSPGNQRIYKTKDRSRIKWILRGKRFGFSLNEISEMIGMADVDMSEIDQIKKSMVFGQRKLFEIQEHKEELFLLEQDLKLIMDRFKKRLKELNKN